ncbi:MAG: hypothetical protein ABIP74_04445 [Candidatus Saccharimonas sp.]
MTELALDIRHRYLDATLVRTAEWLADDGMRQVLGETALATVNSLIGRLYVPNLIAGRRYIKALTPEYYRDLDFFPLLVGFPGDRFIPDGAMMRQTSLQRTTAALQFTEMYGDSTTASQAVVRHDARMAHVASSASELYITRYDTEAATHMHTKLFGPLLHQRRLLGRPAMTLTMADMDEGYVLTSPGTFIHELSHIDDHERAGSVAETEMRAHIIRSEFKAHHISARMEQYAQKEGLVHGDELADYNRFPSRPTYSEEFEDVRTRCTSMDDPFAYSATADSLLVKAGLMRAPRVARTHR